MTNSNSSSLTSSNDRTRPLALAMDALDNHQAEEEPWLPVVFEAPPEFDLISGSRSCIVFGESGSGKSAIYAVLVNDSLDQTGKPRRLLVEWLPSLPLPNDVVSSFLAEQQLSQVLGACAVSLMTFLMRYPETFASAPTWAQSLLIWFVRHYWLGDIETRTGKLAQQVSAAGAQLRNQILAHPIHEVFDANAAPELIIAELVKALAEVGLQGVWVLVDKLEAWGEIDPGRINTGLTAFLSALGLFEQRGFAYKIFLPTTLAANLSNLSAVARRRVDVHHLRWTSPKLTSLLLKRMSLVVGQPVNSLATFCSDDTLLTWLQNCGGQTPRGWLEYIRPLVAAYLERLRAGQSEPIARAEWVDIRRRHPPQLRLEQQRKQVIVGERVIADLSEGQFKLLEHLYKQSGRLCTRSELHYLADMGLASEPRTPADPYYEPPSSYNGKLDTAVYRLRKLIEPDLNDKPLFISVLKGKGYRLDNVYK